MTEARVTDQERPQTVAQRISDARARHARAVEQQPEGEIDDLDWEGRTISQAIAVALGLDPATPLDGPLVVLHPRQHVVEGGVAVGASSGPVVLLNSLDSRITVVASNPQERTP